MRSHLTYHPQTVIISVNNDQLELIFTVVVNEKNFQTQEQNIEGSFIWIPLAIILAVLVVVFLVVACHFLFKHGKLIKRQSKDGSKIQPQKKLDSPRESSGFFVDMPQTDIGQAKVQSESIEPTKSHIEPTKSHIEPTKLHIEPTKSHIEPTKLHKIQANANAYMPGTANTAEETAKIAASTAQSLLNISESLETTPQPQRSVNNDQKAVAAARSAAKDANIA